VAKTSTVRDGASGSNNQYDATPAGSKTWRQRVGSVARVLGTEDLDGEHSGA